MELDENDILYLPAHTGTSKLERVETNNKRYVWWANNYWFHRHKYLLMSAYFGLKVLWERESRLKEDEKDVVMFADSGGFQARSLGVNLPPLKVLQWMERNCQYGFTMDIPPFAKGEVGEQSWEGATRSVLDEENFKNCCNLTKNNNVFFEKYRDEGSKLKIYNVIHGNTPLRFKYWFNEMKNFNFEGYGIGGMIPLSDPFQMFGPIYLHNEGIKKNIHIFGVSGFDIVPILVYYSTFIKKLSFDSSLYIEGRKFRKYILPINPKFKIRLGFGSSKKSVKQWTQSTISKLPCNCNICEYVNENGLMKELLTSKDSTYGFMISTHDLNVFMNYVTMLNNLKSDKEEFKNYVRLYCKPETTEMIKLIDVYLEEGIEKAEKLLYQKTSSVNKQFHSEKSLFNFVGEEEGNDSGI